MGAVHTRRCVDYMICQECMAITQVISRTFLPDTGEPYLALPWRARSKQARLHTSPMPSTCTVKSRTNRVIASAQQIAIPSSLIVPRRSSVASGGAGTLISRGGLFQQSVIADCFQTQDMADCKQAFWPPVVKRLRRKSSAPTFSFLFRAQLNLRRFALPTAGQMTLMLNRSTASSRYQPCRWDYKLVRPQQTKLSGRTGAVGQREVEHEGR